MTMDDDLTTLAQRIWPNAKLIRLSHDEGIVTARGIDAHNEVIGEMSANTPEALRYALNHALPEGGQAP